MASDEKEYEMVPIQGVLDLTEKEKRNRTYMKYFLMGIVAATLFLLGMLGGYFIPRPAKAAHETVPVEKSWKKEGCVVPDLGKCPLGYQNSTPLLVISLDGFWPGYMDRGINPVLEKLGSCGLRARSMRPSHPAITFPNHYSIATGLYVESHGIVDNRFFDPQLRRQFDYKTATVGESVWWGGEPIWVTARKHEKRSHSYFWVGTEAEIFKYRPNVYFPFNASHPFETRVDTVLEWLSRPDSDRPDVTMLYFEEPDSTGHKHGTKSSEINNTLVYVDSTIERLIQGLHNRNLLSCVNIMIVSDHGMDDVSCDHIIGIAPLLETSGRSSSVDLSQYHISGGVQVRISARATANSTIGDLYEALQCPLSSSSNISSPFQIYKKEQLPRRLHYTNTARVEPLIMNLKAGYAAFQTVFPTCTPGGMHGYDNLYPSQQSIFIAHGPSFKSGVEVEPFLNTELYNLMCDLIDVKPAPNNGTYGSLHHLLRKPKSVEAVVEESPLPRFPIQSQLAKGLRGRVCVAMPGCSHVAAVSDADNEPNTTAQDAELKQRSLAPYGLPTAPADFQTNLLINDVSLVGFSVALKLPLWVSFLVDKSMSNRISAAKVSCAQEDIRYNPSEMLSCAEISQLDSDMVSVDLVPSGTAGDSFFPSITSIVPMFDAFRMGVWNELWRMINIWRETEWKLSFHVGPVFDSIYPFGLPDPVREILHVSGNSTEILLPSHFFVIITRNNRIHSCTGTSCMPDVLAFLLPHVANTSSCQDFRSYILTNSATVKDIESVTGLRFFTDMPQYDAIRLRTQLPTRLWDSDSGL